MNRKRRHRIKSKPRFILFLSFVILLSIYAVGTFFGYFDVNSMDEVTYKAVEIHSGDTLWELAGKFGPQNADRRKVIYEICRINEIGAGDIYVGQKILIPDRV